MLHRMHDVPPDIKRFRERFGYSQEDLARIIGVSVRTVQRWEKGIVWPSRLAMKMVQEMVGHPTTGRMIQGLNVDQRALAERMKRLREEIGPIGIRAKDLIEAGRE